MPRVIRSRGSGDVRFNMTPMIDIVFNLIIFFMLVSQFTQLEIEEVVLPPAETAQPKSYEDFYNVVINIINPDSPQVKIMNEPFEPAVGGRLEQYLTDIAGREEETKRLNVILRADARVPYEAVAAVMLAAGRAKIQNWWITTEIEDIEEPGR